MIKFSFFFLRSLLILALYSTAMQAMDKEKTFIDKGEQETLFESINGQSLQDEEELAKFESEFPNSSKWEDQGKERITLVRRKKGSMLNTKSSDSSTNSPDTARRFRSHTVPGGPYIRFKDEPRVTINNRLADYSLHAALKERTLRIDAITDIINDNAKMNDYENTNDKNYQIKQFHIADAQGNTPLHLACMRREEEIIGIIDTLCKLGSNLHAQNVNGRTPLMVAIRNHLSPAHLITILQHKQDLEIATSDGYTALTNAVFSNNHNAAELLIERGVQVNILTKGGCNLLELAVQDEKMQQILSNAGARKDYHPSVLQMLTASSHFSAPFLSHHQMIPPTNPQRAVSSPHFLFTHPLPPHKTGEKLAADELLETEAT